MNVVSYVMLTVDCHRHRRRLALQPMNLFASWFHRYNRMRVRDKPVSTNLDTSNSVIRISIPLGPGMVWYAPSEVMLMSGMEIMGRQGSWVTLNWTDEGALCISGGSSTAAEVPVYEVVSPLLSGRLRDRSTFINFNTVNSRYNPRIPLRPDNVCLWWIHISMLGMSDIRGGTGFGYLNL